jgi:hypothetical protein
MAVMSKLILCLQPPIQVKALNRLLQGHYGVDNGLLLAELSTRHHALFSELDGMVDSLRALFSRTERYVHYLVLTGGIGKRRRHGFLQLYHEM